MANDIQITMGGTDAQALAMWQRQLNQTMKLQKELLGVAQAGELAGNKIGGGMQSASGAIGQAVGQLKQFAGAFVGIAGVVKGIQYITEQIKREYEHLRSQQAGAGQRQTALAPLQRELFENLGDDKTLTPQQANAAVARISERTGMDVGGVMQVMSTALSFKERTATAESVLPLVEMAATMSPESGQAAAANVKAMQAIKKVAPDANAKDIQGFLIGAKLASPVVNAESFGAYTAPGIAQLMSLGNTAQESAAFQGALGQGIGDEEGRITANASITFAKQLKELTAGKVEGGLFQQLEFLQTDKGKAIKAKLLGPLMKDAKNAKKIGLEGEAKAFATLIGFIQGEGRYSDILKGTLSDTPELTGAGSFVDTRQATLENDPLQKNFRMDRALASAADRAQLTQIGSGKQGITLGRLGELLDKAGVTGTEKDILMEAYKVRTEGTPEGPLARLGQGLGLVNPPGELQSPDQAAAGILRFEAQRQRRGKQGSFGGDIDVDVTPERKETAATLDRVAKQLEKVVEQQAELIQRGGQPINVNVNADVPVEAKAGPAAVNDRRNIDAQKL